MRGIRKERSTIPPRKKTNRRGKNEGSIYQRADGKWVGQVTVGYREDNGKAIRRYVYKNNREEAAHWVAMQVATELHKDTVRTDELIIRDFIHNWLTQFKVYEVSSKTMEQYYAVERLYIIPTFDHCPLGALTPLQIQTFLYQTQAAKHLSQRTVSLIRSILVQMYDYAMDMKLVESNPARNVKLPRQPRKIDDEENKVIPIAQREAILKAAESDPIMCPIITMLILTGMRVGEVLALQWKHIDFVNRTMGMRTYSGFRASFRHFLRRNGFPEDINLHRFRHTYASMLLEQDINPKVVQKLLGHRDVTTTLGVYTHVVPEVFAGVTAVLDDAPQQQQTVANTEKS